MTFSLAVEHSAMSTLLDDLTSQLQGNTLSQMSRQLGADEATTAQAISMALPMLIGGLASEAETPTGAQSLNRALEEDHDGSLLDNVSPLFGPATSGAADVAVPRALNISWDLQAERKEFERRAPDLGGIL